MDNYMMEQYIYEVTRRLPRDQRADIAMELEELIGDMLGEGRGIEEVLTELGDPKEFAKRYRDDKDMLIGPEYYQDYLWLLRIALIAVGGSQILSGIITVVIDQGSIISQFADIIINLIMAGIGTFGVITLIFAVCERQKVRIELKEEKVWSVKQMDGIVKPMWTPGQMGPIPNKKARINRSDSTVSVVFILLLCGVLIFAPELLGAHVFEEGESMRTIPILNLERWGLILPVLLFGIFVGLVDEIMRLVTGCYCYMVMISNIICGGIQIVIAVILLKVLPFWNLRFAEQVSETFDKQITSEGDILYYWGSETVGNIILIGVILISVLEAGTTIYKTLRYGVENQERNF